MSRVQIVINDNEVEVEEGTSVAAALVNAGVWRFRQAVEGGFRAPLCVMGVCFECRVTLDGRPHRRACMEICRPGMVVLTDE